MLMSKVVKSTTALAIVLALGYSTNVFAMTLEESDPSTAPQIKLREENETVLLKNEELKSEASIIQDEKHLAVNEKSNDAQDMVNLALRHGRLNQAMLCEEQWAENF